MSPQARAMVDGGSKKRGKTDDDHAQLAAVEFETRLYYDEKVGVYVPGDAIHSALVEAAKSEKMGKNFKRSVMIMEDKLPLIYDGPKRPQALFDKGFYDRRTVVMQNRRIPRTRPMFQQWALEVEVTYAEENVNEVDLIRIATYAGRFVGIGDYRPKFGRFEVAKA